jgi:hypothetical protein
MKYFSNQPDGFQFHDTAEAAKKEAEEALQYYADEAASDGWNEEVESICWGEVKECVVMVSCKKAPRGSQFSEIVEYKLKGR